MNQPIPLVTISPHTNVDKCPQFSINQKAIDLLSEIQGPIGVVTIAGLYRTGKSFILNRLAGSNRGFAVGSLVEPCTQGIYVWIITDPPARLKSLLKTPDLTIVLLDTEGLGSFTKSKTYDVKLFSLAVLLSSLFLYNSMGSIDESAIDRLSLVAELSNHIRLQQAADENPDAYSLNKFFPKFVWLVRDFGLKLELDGQPISSDQYLESVLQPLEGDSDKIRSRNSIRRSIVQYFPDRHCFTLKRPVNDEKQLQILDYLEESDIRPQFLDQMKLLTEFVYATIQPKQLFSRKLTGSNFAQLTASYVHAMNTGGVPVIRSAWENVVLAECEQFLALSYKNWIKQWDAQVVACFPLEDQALLDIYLGMQDQFMTGLRIFISDKQVTDGIANDVETKLRAYMRKSLKNAIETNQIKSQLASGDLLTKIYEKLVIFLEEDGTDFEQFESELSLLIKEKYLALPLGPAKHASLADFLTKKVIGLYNTVHQKRWARRETEINSETKKQTERNELDRKNAEKLVQDMKLNFTKSRQEVEQLAVENQELIKVVAKFSHIVEDNSDLSRTSVKPNKPRI